jgi:hypothetical protein
MRAAYTTLTGTLLLLSACKDGPAPVIQTATAPRSDVPAAIADAPGMKERGPAQPVQHPALPLSQAQRTLPRNPFTILRGQAEMERHWKLAGGTGAAPRVDFARAAVIAIRLPADADPARMAPRIYSIQQGTHILLHAGTPRELGSRPTDRIHYYQVATEAGPVASVQYPGT